MSEDLELELELKKGFLDEAAQLLTDTEQCFLALESNADDTANLDKIFRLAHNLKGSAKAVGFSAMGEFAHILESFLLKLKNKEMVATPAVVTLLLECNDHLVQMVEALKADLNAVVDSSAIASKIQAQMEGKNTPPEPLTINPEHLGEMLERETEAHMNALSEEVVPLPVAQLPKKVAPAKVAVADENIRVSLARLEKLLNFIGEMVILQTVLREQTGATGSHLLRKTVHQLGKVTKEVQDISMSLRMVPLKPTFQKMQRIVRDVASSLSKEIILNMEGEETELDKTVLEAINDPLVHLIRNAVDHGIEKKETRIAAGKNPNGTINLCAFQRGGKLILEIRDDGGGINPAIIKAKAIEKKIIRPDASITDAEAIKLIFHPGFSTKTEVTDVSGRGVGMDVVKTNIESLQGEVQVESEVGKGSCFRILLPLTLAIIDGMVVESEDQRYVIPLSQVHESLRPENGQITGSVSLGEILMLRGENLPLYRLSALLKRKLTQTKDGIAIVVRAGGSPFAVMVDDIIGQQQVVVKKLGGEIQGLRMFGGSAILGDGKPALILELSEVVNKMSVGAKPREMRSAA